MRAGGVVHFDLKHHTGKKRGKNKTGKKKKEKKKDLSSSGYGNQNGVSILLLQAEKGWLTGGKGTDRTANC